MPLLILPSLGVWSSNLPAPTNSRRLQKSSVTSVVTGPEGVITSPLQRRTGAKQTKTV